MQLTESDVLRKAYDIVEVMIPGNTREDALKINMLMKFSKKLAQSLLEEPVILGKEISEFVSIK